MASDDIDFARLLGLAPEVHQAVGMIGAQLDVNVEAAAMCLMVAADAEGRTLEQLAEEVITRRRRFDQPTP